MSAAKMLDRETRLARLVEQQADDAATRRLPGSRLFVRECDLPRTRDDAPANMAELAGTSNWSHNGEAVAAELEKLPVTERFLGGLTFPIIILGVTGPWGDAERNYDPRKGVPCPVCHDHPRRGGVCIVCSRTWRDHRGWPNAPAPRDDYVWQSPRQAKPAPRVVRRAEAKAANELASRVLAATRPVKPKPPPAATHVRVRLKVAMKGRQAGDVLDLRESIAASYVACGAAERVR